MKIEWGGRISKMDKCLTGEVVREKHAMPEVVGPRIKKIAIFSALFSSLFFVFL